MHINISEKMAVLYGIDFGFGVRWVEKINLLKEFVKQNNRFPSRVANNKQEILLAQWCKYVRRRKRKGKISKERQRQLEGVGGWNWGEDDVWQKSFDSLKNFIKRHKILPLRSHWVISQKQSKHKGHLSEERQKQLESIDGWTWEMVSKNVNKWQNSFNLLKKFLEKNQRFPNFNPPTKQEKTIYRWAHGQKQGQANCRRGTSRRTLSKEKQKQLEGIKGWKWSRRVSGIWENNFNKLNKFIKKYKKLPFILNQRHMRFKTKEELFLARWICGQKHRRKKDKLSEERQKKLESVVGWEWECIK